MNYENAWIKYVVVISTADLKPQELIQSAFQVSKKKKKPGLFQKTFGRTVKLFC